MKSVIHSAWQKQLSGSDLHEQKEPKAIDVSAMHPLVAMQNFHERHIFSPIQFTKCLKPCLHWYPHRQHVLHQQSADHLLLHDVHPFMASQHTLLSAPFLAPESCYMGTAERHQAILAACFISVSSSFPSCLCIPKQHIPSHKPSQGVNVHNADMVMS
jgi:hypothetical protein